MDSNIDNKLHCFNPQRPYVWEMKLTEDEFVALEKELCAKQINYSNKENALLVLVYMAEWYKRRYTNKSKSAYQRTFGNQKPDLKTVWETLGINHDFLYQSKDGKNLYLHSIFILGGLAVHFEQQKNEKPFLRALCRVYNNEDDSFDTIVDNNHSIAFKKSIVHGHCLRDFLEAIITSQGNADKLPYAISDIDDKKTEIASLIELIREINYQVNKSKFRFEWVITAIPGDDLISRRLRIWLNPEEKGALHQLLRIERLIKWGFTEPEKMRYIRLGVRYLNEGQVIKNADFTHPDLYYRNTGDVNVGFICEKVDYATCKNVPIIAFNQVQLVAWDDNEKELIVQDDMIDFDVMQLYRLEPGEDDWSSRVSNQKETALVFSDNWLISQNSVDQLAEKKTFYHKKYGIGDSINWCYINASVTIECGNDSRTYFNRQGYDHIIAHQYKETIQYTEDGKVMWHHSDDEESPEIIQPIFLIFSKSDIVAYHTENKEAGDEETCEATDIERYEYKTPGGNYLEWTTSNVPDYGYVKLRLTIKQKEYLVEAFYLPKPVERNVEDNTIHYHDGIEDKLFDDRDNIETAQKRKQILTPVVTLNIGTKTSYVKVSVFRPVKLKEIIYDGKIRDYMVDGEYELPYILHNHIIIHSYNEQGFEEYNCALLKGVHKFIKERRRNNPDAAWASSAAWENGDIYRASDIDIKAPKFLKVKMGERLQSVLNNEEFFFWDYNQDHPLLKMPIRGVKAPVDWGVVFQSNKNNKTGKNYYPLYNEDDVDDIFDDDDDTFDDENNNLENVSIINCFNIAIEHELYFFTFTPLKRLSEDEFNKQLLLPILKEYDGTLPPEICKGLLRFVEEYDYLDKERYYNKINKNI